MYSLDFASLKNLRGRRVAAIGSNVVCLGLTSMLTDVSSEMVASVLPIWFVFAMGLTPLQFGVVDGLSQGAAVVARLLGGPMADRWRRHRDVAALGYGLSAISRPLLLAAGGGWGAASAVIAMDRMGKGIRTSPRDALISLSCEPHQLGRAFGIHRALDTAGALLGPLVASAMLAVVPQAFDLVFVTSFFVAIMGLAVLLCFVKETKAPAGIAGARRGPGLVALAALLRDARLRSITLVAAALGAFTVGDAFVFLMLQRKLSTQPAWFPLFYAVTAGAYLVLAIPAGSLGDRFGRPRAFLAGHGFLLLAGIDLLASGSSLFAGLVALGPARRVLRLHGRRADGDGEPPRPGGATRLGPRNRRDRQRRGASARIADVRCPLERLRHGVRLDRVHGRPGVRIDRVDPCPLAPAGPRMTHRTRPRRALAFAAVAMLCAMGIAGYARHVVHRGGRRPAGRVRARLHAHRHDSGDRRQKRGNRDRLSQHGARRQLRPRHLGLSRWIRRAARCRATGVRAGSLRRGHGPVPGVFAPRRHDLSRRPLRPAFHAPRDRRTRRAAEPRPRVAGRTARGLYRLHHRTRLFDAGIHDPHEHRRRAHRRDARRRSRGLAGHARRCRLQGTGLQFFGA